MATHDWRMNPAWTETGSDHKTLYYRGLPNIGPQSYFTGSTEASGLTTGYDSYMTGMMPIDTSGYRTVEVSMYNLMWPIGWARMHSSYSSGISKGDFLWMRSTGTHHQGRRDLLRVLKVITDAYDGGVSNATAEPILILERQLDQAGWPHPENNGHGGPTSGLGGNGGGYVHTGCGGYAGHSGTIELVTENLASGGTAYPVATVGNSLPTTDSAGLALGAACSIEERTYWLPGGEGGYGDLAMSAYSAYPAVIDATATGEMVDMHRDGFGNNTFDIDKPGNHKTHSGWGHNRAVTWNGHYHSDVIRDMYHRGESQHPFFHAGNSAVKDAAGGDVLWEGRWFNAVSGYIENPPKNLILGFAGRNQSNYGYANRAQYYVTFSGQPADGETVTITDDNSNVKVFEFESGGGVTGANVSVAIDASHAAATAINLKTAIRAQTNTGAGSGGFRVTADADADFYLGTSTVTGSDKVVQVAASNTGSTTNFAVAESAANVTVAKVFDGHDGGGFRSNGYTGDAGVIPGGYNHTAWTCVDLNVVLKK